MNMALFAARNVGYQVAKFYGDNKEPLSCLVLDAKDDSGLNSKIIEESGVSPNKVFYSDALYKDETTNALGNMNLDLIILAWWPYIIKEKLLSLPRMGCLNFHPSYLPYNRGKHYNFWAIVEEVPFGVSLNSADKGIDTGDIAYQSLIETSWEDTGESLYIKAQEEIVRLFKEKFPDIKTGRIPRVPQDLSKGSFHNSNELEESSRIDLDKGYKARTLLNLLRARTFPPHPGAWFIDKGQKFQARLEIKRVDGPDEKNHE